MKFWIKNLKTNEYIGCQIPKGSRVSDFVRNYYPDLKDYKIFYKNPFFEKHEEEKMPRIKWKEFGVLNRLKTTASSAHDDHLFAVMEGVLTVDTNTNDQNFMLEKGKNHNTVFMYVHDNQLGKLWHKEVPDGKESEEEKVLENTRRQLLDLFEKADKEAEKILQKNGFKRHLFMQR